MLNVLPELLHQEALLLVSHALMELSQLMPLLAALIVLLDVPLAPARQLARLVLQDGDSDPTLVPLVLPNNSRLEELLHVPLVLMDLSQLKKPLLVPTATLDVPLALISLLARLAMLVMD